MKTGILFIGFSVGISMVAAVTAPTDVSRRFYDHFEEGKTLSKLELAEEDVPPDVLLRISRNKDPTTVLSWKSLPGQLQRAVLWDSGYVKNVVTGLYEPVLVECGLKMRNVQINLDTYAKACNSKDNLLVCPNGQRRQQNCDGSSLAIHLKCAMSSEFMKGINSSMWVESGSNADLPDPTASVHTLDGTARSWRVVGLQMLIDPDWGTCPENSARTEPIIPCVALDKPPREGMDWCAPVESPFVNNWIKETTLASLAARKAEDEGESEGESGFSTIIGIVGGALILVAVALVFVYRRKRAGEDVYLPHHGGNATIHKTLGSLEAPSNMTLSCSDESTGAREVLQLKLSGAEVVDSNNVQVVKTLGEGSNGEVLLAKYAGVHVAVKRMHPWKAKQAVEEFKHEIDLLKSFRHPNIVQFIGVTVFNDIGLCSICEYMDKGDLLTVLMNKSLKLSWSQQLGSMALDSITGLVYLHNFQSPIMHRDLKSRNILINQHFGAKLGDFGISREISDDTMTMAGTNLWLAPEIYRGEKYTEKCDIYSFGIVLTELDSRKLPYWDAKDSKGQQMNSVAIAYKVAFEGLTPTLTPKCPKKLRALIQDCIQHDASLRPTATEVQQRLRKIVASPRLSSASRASSRFSFLK